MSRITAAAKLTLLVFLLVVASLAFVVRLLWFTVPTAEARLKVAPRTAVEGVFGCAERQLADLTAEDDRWLPEVTRRDLSDGRLETGRFPDDNVTGFRLRLDYDRDDGEIALRLKGAGAYFTDQGVDAAMALFRQRMADCLSAASPSAVQVR